MIRKSTISRAARAVTALVIAGSILAVPVYAEETELVPTEIEETELEEEAEEMAPQISWQVRSEIEDGILTIRIENSDYANPEFWWQDSLLDKGDASLVGLTKMTESEDLAFCGDYKVLDEAEGDGEDCIRLVYTNGFYTEEYMEWYVSVKDGKIEEVTGGGQAFGTSATDLLPVLSGTWQEEGGTRTMEVTLGDNNSLEFTIADVNDNGEAGDTYKMHAYYDAEKMALVYWDAVKNPTGSEDEAEADGTGIFGVFPASEDTEDESDLIITWQDNSFGNDDTGDFVRVTQ